MLERDPGNVGLTCATLDAALAAGRFDLVTEIADRIAQSEPLPASVLNALGLAALSQGQPEDAVQIFGDLVDENPDVPQLRYNLASAYAKLGQHEIAAGLIDSTVVQGTPGAACLKVRSLHHLGRVDEALEVGTAVESLIERDPELAGSLALVALDAGQTERAERWAEASTGSVRDNVVGMLALADGDATAAVEAFDRALAISPDSGRARVGMGSALLSKGSFAEAAAHLDAGAETFGDHPGSWIAAGWAHLLNGDHAAAQARFERALAVDGALAEAHGGLAVLELLRGDADQARRRAAIGGKLDQQAMGPVLARILLHQQDGQVAEADRLRQAALEAKVGLNGESLTDAIQKFLRSAAKNA